MSDVQASPATVAPETPAEPVQQPTWIANAQPPATPADPVPPVIDQVEKVATDVVEEGAIAAVESAVEVVHTHGTILSGLMKDLEGMVHMAKAEVEAVVDRYRKLFEAL